MVNTKICSMYSYKGGAGRTVATANIAFILAKEFGKKVVCIDMDLDGGGLAVVFKVHHEINGESAFEKRINDERRCIQDVFKREVDLTRFSKDNKSIKLRYDEIESDDDFKINWWDKMNFDIGEKFSQKDIKGKLFFIPARFGTDYIDLSYDDFNIGFKKFKDRLIDKEKPDLILIDSSSGFQDYTMMLIEHSHLFVMFFRWNSQSIEGSIGAANFILWDYDPNTEAKMLLVPSAVPKASLENYKGIHEASKSRIDIEIVSNLRDKGKKVEFFEEGIGESALLKWKEEILVLKNQKELEEEEKLVLEDYRNVAKQMLEILEND